MAEMSYDNNESREYEGVIYPLATATKLEDQSPFEVTFSMEDGQKITVQQSWIIADKSGD